MKLRFYISLIAIASLAMFGWWNHQRIANLRENRERLNALAVKMGIPAQASLFTKRYRTDRIGEAKLAASRLINHHKQLEASRLAEGRSDPLPGNDTNVSQEWMAALDSSQIRVVIREILSDTELDDRSRRTLIADSLGFLVENNPAAALVLFSEFSTYLKTTVMGQRIAYNSLGVLAKDDLHAAFSWAKNHKDEFPSIVQSAQDALIYNAANQDPALAFEIIREFGPEYFRGNAESYLLSSSSSEMRSSALVAFRQHLATIASTDIRQKIEQQAYQGLAGKIAKDGFEAGSKWLTSAAPTQDEMIMILENLGVGLLNARGRNETASWMEWTAATLPAGQREELISGMMRSWTRSDYEAAGKWLASAVTGPAKNAAIRGYAQTVFKHDPETAMQWIMTLPPGEERQQTLRYILRNRLGDNPEAAAAFAKEHGITE